MTFRLSFSLETLLYAALACLALALRLYGLGAQPLTDAEAHDALPAYRFVQADDPFASEAEPLAVPRSPLLFSLTSLAFLLFGASDATARLAPALAGTALVLMPSYFRRQLGPLAALLLAGLLAISPALIAASRTADATVLVALAFAIAAGSLAQYAHFRRQRYLYYTAAAVGAALAGGPRTITALLILALTALLWRLFDAPAVAEARAAWRGPESGTVPWGRLAAVAALVFIAASSALVLYRAGPAAAAQAIPTWLAGWAAGAAVSWLHLPALLLIYEPLILGLGLAGLLSLAVRRSAADHAGWALAALSLAALAVGLLYPGRTSADVIWIVIPLAGLSSVFVVKLFEGDWSEIDLASVAIQTGLVVVLLCFAGLNLNAFGQAERSFTGNAAANLGLAGVALALIGLISLLFGIGWSAAGAVRGLVLGLGLALLFASFSGAARLVHWGEDPEAAGELWAAGGPAPLSGQRLLLSTLEQVSDNAVGSPHDLEVVVNAPREGALAWALREFHAAAYTDQLAANIAAPAVIAPAEESTPELGSAYVGQSFAVRGQLDLASRALLDWVDWLVFERQPTQLESLVLWVRSDVQFQTGDVPVR